MFIKLTKERLRLYTKITNLENGLFKLNWKPDALNAARIQITTSYLKFIIHINKQNAEKRVFSKRLRTKL